jgi:hypothetical protein
MEWIAGTAAGVFGSGAGSQASGLTERGVRHLSMIGGDFFAGASDGIYRSGDGRSWKRVGAESTEVWDIGHLTGDDRTLYAGTQPAHIFESRDGGGSWSEMESFLRAPGAATWCLPGTPPPSARARTLVFDATNPDRFHVGVEVGGVASSADRGASWTVSLPGGNPDIHVLVAHPAKAGVIFATTGFGRIDNSEPHEKRIAGTFRSDDGGRTWTYLWKDIKPPYTRPICIDPRAPYAITVACAPTAFSTIKNEGGAQAMLYRSDNDGASWHSLGDADHSPSAANFLSVTVDMSEPGSVLVGTETGEVWRVRADASWTKLADGMPPVQALLATA